MPAGVCSTWRFMTDARPRLARPGERSLVVALDEADGAVDDVRLERAQVACGHREEVREERSRDVQLA